MRYTKSDQQESRDWLSERLKPGDTVLCVLRNVSRSGMSRRIDFIKMSDPETTVYMTYHIARLLGYKCDHNGNGLTVSGCGMDMGFAVVYELSSTLWSNGFGCIGKNCRSNDHSNGDRDYRPHEDHTGGDQNHICAKQPETCKAFKHWHKDGGYALNYKWL